jgi:signal transduction histidine kinase
LYRGNELIREVHIKQDGEVIAGMKNGTEKISSPKAYEFILSGHGTSWGVVTVTSDAKVVEERIAGRLRDITIRGGGILFLALILSYLFAGLLVRELNKITTIIQERQEALKGAKDLKELEHKLSSHLNPPTFIREVANLVGLFQDYLRITRETNKRVYALESEARLGQLAFQIAHDIRSPLLALKSLSRSPGDEGEKLSLGIERIEEVAANLLKTYTTGGILPEKENVETDIVDLCRKLVEEKKAELIFIESWADLILKTPNVKISARVYPTGLKNVLSNLINNSAEALAKQKGKVQIEVTEIEGSGVIEIIDNGPGISPHILEKILIGGYTTKPNGHGLGLSGARKEIEVMGGRFEISSHEGKGTTIRLIFPPLLSVHQRVVLIDDEKLNRILWQKFLTARGVSFVSFPSVSEFLKMSQALPKDTAVFIDSNLGDGRKGEVESEEIYRQGFHTIYLSTSFDKSDVSKPVWIREIFSKDPEEIFGKNPIT